MYWAVHSCTYNAVYLPSRLVFLVAICSSFISCFIFAAHLWLASVQLWHHLKFVWLVSRISLNCNIAQCVIPDSWKVLQKLCEDFVLAIYTDILFAPNAITLETVRRWQLYDGAKQKVIYIKGHVYTTAFMLESNLATVKHLVHIHQS